MNYERFRVYNFDRSYNFIVLKSFNFRNCVLKCLVSKFHFVYKTVIPIKYFTKTLRKVVTEE